MAVDMVTLGQRLKAARENRELTQDHVATELKISRPQVSKIEAGNQAIDLGLLDALAELYGVTASDLLSAQTTDDVLSALLRASPDLEESASAEIQAEITRHLKICRAGAELERRLGREDFCGPPAYSFAGPSSAGEAVAQGELAARQERGRLGLGSNPIPDMADLIAATGVWASGSRFPSEISGLYLRQKEIGLVVLVNYFHSRARKRFSYAHEYGHVLLDRDHTVAISKRSNRAELSEVRANAFAAAFLLPQNGVNRFLLSRRKGLRTRTEMSVYDLSIDNPEATEQETSLRATARTLPGSQKISYQDIAALAHHFGASYQAAAYRLKGMNLVTQTELATLLEKEQFGQRYLALLKLDKDAEEQTNSHDRDLTKQVVDLSIEAFRRELIDRNYLLELGVTLGIAGQELVKLAEAA